MVSPSSSVDSALALSPLANPPKRNDDGIMPLVVAGGSAFVATSLVIVASLVVLVAGVALAIAFPPAAIPITLLFSATAAFGLMLSLLVGSVAGGYFGSKFDS
ncbi:MAG: hypothetical protein KDK62_06670 [Chlamydiia bacterium]|nr:hypothetical protein [Chlamydiia bacterium]